MNQRIVRPQAHRFTIASNGKRQFADLLQRQSEIDVRLGHIRLQFDVSGCNREQKELLRDLRVSTVLNSVTPLGPVELE